MSLVWMDGFESYGIGDGADISALLAQRYVVYALTYFSTQTGRTGGYAMKSVDGSYWMRTPALTTDPTLIVNFGFRADSFVPSNAGICSLYNGTGTEGMSLHWLSDDIAVYKGGSQVDVTSALGLTFDTWYFIEFKVVTGEHGSYVLKVNGDIVLQDDDYDTRPGGTEAYHDRVKFWGGSYMNPRVDDLFIFDGTGSTNNDFVGDHRILAILPNEAGDVAEWTGSGASTHYTYVDENPYNTSDYVQDDVTGHQELYGYSDLANIGEILGITIFTAAVVLDVTPFTLKTLAKLSGGSVNADAGQTVSELLYGVFPRQMETDPNGSPWTMTTINTAQFGVEIG
jgi:hypothetical protein